MSTADQTHRIRGAVQGTIAGGFFIGLFFLLSWFFDSDGLQQSWMPFWFGFPSGAVLGCILGMIFPLLMEVIFDVGLGIVSRIFD